MKRLEEIILKKEHGKLFYWLVKYKFINYQVEINPTGIVTHTERWKFNVFNPIVDIILFIYLILLLVSAFFVSGLCGVKRLFIKAIAPHVKLNVSEIKEIEENKEHPSLSKLQALLKALDQGKYTAVERYLSRVYNIRRHGEYYIQDYFTPENGYSYRHIWIINSKWTLNVSRTNMSSGLVYEKKESLLNILEDIKQGKIKPIIKISLREILEKFELTNYNPGLIKIVKNKQEDKGFKYKHWDDETRK